MPRDTGPFRVSERVLVAYTDKYYEAKVTKAEKRPDGWYYMLHYTGWNKKYDEWVEAPGLTKFNAALLGMSLDTVGAGAAASGGPGSRSAAGFPGAAAPSSRGALTGAGALPAADAAADGGTGNGAFIPALSGAGGGGEGFGGVTGGGGGGGRSRAGERKRRRVDEIGGGAFAPLPGPPVRAALPAALKQALLDDWQRASQAAPPPLPRKPCVDTILQRYLDRAPGSLDGPGLEESIAMGLRIYFDKALPQQLLYASEREQADEALAGGLVPSSLYGGEHLLRLLQRLPALLPTGSLAPAALASIEAGLAHFLKFLLRHQGDFFQAPLPPQDAGADAGAPEDDAADAEEEDEAEEVDMSAYDF
ncbi:hypothetical protein WJX81_007200 [Elliptochloris bilobata]|uniref:MRG domain-containing protein n=1 Tax=Elliptochloris bilobata TaxID=381761 RepID=A0AAW1SLW9_9CHLO